MSAPARRLALAAAFAATSLVLPVAVAGTRLARTTLSTGGGVATAAGRTLLSTAGQPIVSPSSSRLCSGWWCVEGPASVDVPEAVGTAPALAFLRPFPNPATDALHLVYALPRSGRMRLEVIDAQGRRVALLRDGFEPAGRSMVTWDGRAGSGLGVESGLYFVRLVFDATVVATHRISVIR